MYLGVAFYQGKYEKLQLMLKGPLTDTTSG